MSLEKIIKGWYTDGGKIINERGDNIKYKKYEKIPDGLKIKTRSKEFYIFEKDPDIYRIEEESRGYKLVRSKNGKRVIGENSISSKFDDIDWETTDEFEDIGWKTIVYACVEKNGKYTFMRFNGKEKLSEEYDNVIWRVMDNVIYGIVKRDGKEAIIKFDGEERLSSWYDEVDDNAMISGGIAYAGVFDGKKWSILKYDWKEEKLSGSYNSRIKDLKVENGEVSIKLDKNKWEKVEFS